MRHPYRLAFPSPEVGECLVAACGFWAANFRISRVRENLNLLALDASANHEPETTTTTIAEEQGPGHRHIALNVRIEVPRRVDSHTRGELRLPAGV